MRYNILYVCPAGLAACVIVSASGRPQELFAVMATAERKAGRAIQFPQVVPRSSLTDSSSFDRSKGGLRLSRGIQSPLWPPCIGRGVCGLVTFRVDGVWGRAHACLSRGWWRHAWTGLADQPGFRRAGVNASLPSVGPHVARHLAHASCASLRRPCPTTCVRMSSLAPGPAMTRVKPRQRKAPAAAV
jgi:hypothetical protein